MALKILRYDPWLKPYEKDLLLRMSALEGKLKTLLPDGTSLADFATGHLYFGFHKTADGWFYREWAPGAEKMYLTGDFCHWDRYAYPLERKENGVFEVFLPGRDTLRSGMRVRAIVVHNGQELERIPLYATRVVQDTVDHSWDAVIHEMQPFAWTDAGFKPKKRLFIYECHIGMAQEEGKVGTYREFKIGRAHV